MKKYSPEGFHRIILMVAVSLMFLQCNEKIKTGSSQKILGAYDYNQFVMGADLSYVNQVQDYGGVYKDSGKIKDPFQIFRDHGANLVRVRLWNNPGWQAELNIGRLYNDIEDVIKTMRRAKAAGMAVNLDLHYSDTWADPDHQEKPLAWKDLDLAGLKKAVYDYTLSVLNYLKERDLVPEMIQVGNENNDGMLFPEGKVVKDNWQPFAQLLQSGINAVRDFSKTSTIKPQIILHVAQLQHAVKWCEAIIQREKITDFDIIGLSHYNKWSTIKEMSEVSKVIRQIKNTYDKKVMVVETAWPWTDQNADSYTNIISGTEHFDGYGVSKEEQLRYLTDLVGQIIDGGGTGIMYWEPAWITSSLRDRWGKGSSWENNALFDFSGNALPAIDYMRPVYKLSK